MTPDAAVLASVLAQSGIEGSVAGPAGIPVAFVVGMVSFFSPCVLPLVPGYLSYTSGVSGKALEEGTHRRRVLLAAALFVLGFSIIFTALGATASAIGGFLLDRFDLVNRVAGALIVAMGLVFLSGLFVRSLTRAAAARGARARLARGALRVVGTLNRERGIQAGAARGVRGALPLGAAFAVGWTPCVGPGLATILTVAGTERSAGRGAVLLFSFSLGFGLWLVLAALAFHRAARAFAWVRLHVAVLTATGGIFMVAIGVLLLTDQWARLLAPLRRLINNFAPPI